MLILPRYTQQQQKYQKIIMQFLMPQQSQSQHYSYGIRNYKQGNYQAAIDQFSKEIESHPDKKQAYIYRGLSESQVKHFDQAQNVYTKTIELDPQYALAYYNRGVIHHEKGEYEKAVEDYTSALRINPKMTLAYHNRGVAYNELQQYQPAIDDFSQAISLQSNFAASYNSRGNTYSQLKQYDKAVEDYSQAIDYNSVFVLAYNNRGVAYLQNRQYQQARKDFQKAIEILANYPLAMFNLSTCYYKMGDEGRARGYYKEAVKILDEHSDNQLKEKYMLSQGNVRCVRVSSYEYQKIKSELDELEVAARDKGRTDVEDECKRLHESNERNSVQIIAQPQKISSNETLYQRMDNVYKELKTKPAQESILRSGIYPYKDEQSQKERCFGLWCCGN